MSSYKVSVKVVINKKRQSKTVQVPATGSKKQKVTQIIDSDSDEDYLPEMPQQFPPKDKEEASSEDDLSLESNSEQEEGEQEGEQEEVPNMPQQVPEMQEYVQRTEMVEVEEKEDIPVLPDRFTHRGPSVDYQGRTYHWHPARVIPAQYYKPKTKVVRRTVRVARNNK